MADGLGLLVEDCGHLELLNSLNTVPVTFGAVDRRSLPKRWWPPLIVENQGRTNSCGGHTSALASSHANYVQTGQVVRFSRRFAYVTAQHLGGFSGRDGGTSIESLIRAQTQFGDCLEVDDPFTEAYNPGWSDEAAAHAAKHKHRGDIPYDLRDWDKAIEWLTDRRSILMGTLWTTGQDVCRGIEDRSVGTSGKRRGYHARLAVGWDTSEGEICPRIQNSHGEQWADGGRSTVTPDLWEWWCRDPYFVCIGFNEIGEVEPVRRSWRFSRAGDSC
jgi:hypothetical protein